MAKETTTTTTTTQKPTTEPGYVPVPARVVPTEPAGQPLIKPAQPATETTVTVEKESV